MSIMLPLLRSALRQCRPSLRSQGATIGQRLHTTGLSGQITGTKMSLVQRSSSLRGLEKLASKPFRRSYHGSDSSPQASYRAAKLAVRSLILVNTGIFLAWNYAAATKDIKLIRFLNANALLTEANLAAGRYHTLITAAFSHNQLGHFAFNMFAFWTFAGMLAYIPGVGAAHIYGLVFTSAIASSAAWLAYQRSKGPKIIEKKLGLFTTSRVQVTDAALGASGVAMATAATATCLWPMAPMMIMAVVPAPLFVGTGLFTALDLYLLDSEDKIGHSAHLGGFAFGIAYYLLMLRKRGGIWQMMRRR